MSLAIAHPESFILNPIPFFPTPGTCTDGTTPAAAFPPLWHDHCEHRRLSRTHAHEARQLALYLGAALDQKCLQVPHFPDWCRAVAIPHPAAVALMAPFHHPPDPPPALTCGHRQLTVRLQPQHAAITRHALENLQNPAEAPGEPLRPGMVVAEELMCATQGPLREKLLYFRQHHPDDFDPAAVAALPPITVAPLKSSCPPPNHSAFTTPTSDAEFTYLFARLRALERDHRREARELSKRLPELGRLLAAVQDELARPGRKSRFRSYLRQHHVPLRTAYRLIANVRPPENSAEVEQCALPTLELRTETITLQLDPQEAVMTHAALETLVSSPRCPDFSELIAAAFSGLLTGPARAESQRLWKLPPEAFPPPRFLRPLQIEGAAWPRAARRPQAARAPRLPWTV